MTAYPKSSVSYQDQFLETETDNKDTLGKEAPNIKTQLMASLEAQGIVTSRNNVPFWLRANHFGSIPLSGYSTSWTGRLAKSYSPNPKNKLFDWGAAVETRLNVGSSTNIILVEGYAKARISILQFKAGRSKDVMGLADSTLSVGSFAMSGNALGIPKVEISIPEFWAIPVWGGFFSVKGNFSFGWLGSTPILAFNDPARNKNVTEVNSYLHQKSFYGRLGKPNWRLHVYAGFNHQTTYGNEDEIYKDFNLGKFESFVYAVTGKTWVGDNEFRTKLGNQLGSIDFGITYDFNSTQLFLYRQQIYDVGALAHLANVRDGLTGISFKNKKPGNIGWTKLLFEFLYTKNQAGESWSPYTPSGDEDYYNNFMYGDGWSYKGLGIGNPFLTPRHEGRDNLRYAPGQYFVNNRVIAFHTGMEGNIASLKVKLKLSYSQNYGTFGSSPIGSSLGSVRDPLPPPYFERVNQFSGYVECYQPLKRDWQVGLATAFDSGKLLYSSIGGFVSVKKYFRF
ncbi:capsule assembly Wzi family protein [Dyadobacter sp. LJ53]|uniref:capsule assembly Wzi family protein n=1 Tax=Dyadobacter chenwenxiniae TaxID=2906456 RepID=UPI001F44093B|nr:capsule assembly Wzi family protein [Dyadobacter chenwenxiniae]MCF0048427.1 capsule assembly Wzi family protein [Dyadobacter chenwenxiniae]